MAIGLSNHIFDFYGFGLLAPDIKKTTENYCDCLEENDGLPVQEKIHTCEGLLAKAYHWSDDPLTIQKKNKALDSLLTQDCAEFIKTKRHLKKGTFLPIRSSTKKKGIL